MKRDYVIGFWELVQICQDIARDLHTLMEFRDYDEYDWGEIIFETDKFGGVYVGLHYDYNTGVLTNWYGTDHAQEIRNEEELRELVEREMNYMLKHRDMQYISDMINSEY